MHLVSIIIPVHKTISFLKDCVSSALNQDYEKIEVIIACNGNLEIETCKAFLGDFDPRIVYIKTASGRHHARNEALKIAKGKLVQYLDYDDILYPSKISKQIEEINKSENTIAICKWKKFKIDKDEFYNFPFEGLFSEKQITALKLIDKLGESNGFVATAAYLFPTEIIKNISWVDTPNDDAVFFSEVCVFNPKIITINECLVGYRIHDINTSVVTSREQFQLLLNGWKAIESNLKFYRSSRKQWYFFNAYHYLSYKSIELDNVEIILILQKCMKYATSIKDYKKIALILKSIILHKTTKD